MEEISLVTPPLVCRTSFNEHGDVIKWKHFPRYWQFVRGIHRSPVNSPHKRPFTPSFNVFFDLSLNKRLNKQWWCWWFETLSRSLWRHCNGSSGHVCKLLVVFYVYYAPYKLRPEQYGGHYAGDIQMHFEVCFCRSDRISQTICLLHVVVWIKRLPL